MIFPISPQGLCLVINTLSLPKFMETDWKSLHPWHTHQVRLYCELATAKDTQEKVKQGFQHIPPFFYLHQCFLMRTHIRWAYFTPNKPLRYARPWQVLMQFTLPSYENRASEGQDSLVVSGTDSTLSFPAPWLAHYSLLLCTEASQPVSKNHGSLPQAGQTPAPGLILTTRDSHQKPSHGLHGVL